MQQKSTTVARYHNEAGLELLSEFFGTKSWTYWQNGNVFPIPMGSLYYKEQLTFQLWATVIYSSQQMKEFLMLSYINSLKSIFRKFSYFPNLYLIRVLNTNSLWLLRTVYSNLLKNVDILKFHCLLLSRNFKASTSSIYMWRFNTI